jgi:translation initiation factor 2 beta subunit (eIF-2beta)/eIF-5
MLVGRGNGIKTVIVNMSDIAKALHVDPRCIYCIPTNHDESTGT